MWWRACPAVARDMAAPVMADQMAAEPTPGLAATTMRGWYRARHCGRWIGVGGCR
jgi:hypothetical protein